MFKILLKLKSKKNTTSINEYYCNLWSALWIPLDMIPKKGRLDIVVSVSILETDDLPLVTYSVKILKNNELFKEFIVYECSEGLMSNDAANEKRKMYMQLAIDLANYFEEYCKSEAEFKQTNIIKKIDSELSIKGLKYDDSFSFKRC